MERETLRIVVMAIAVLSYVLAGGPQAAESKNEEYDQVQANLRRFDQLDFDAYSERKNMKLFREIHYPDVKVVFPIADRSITFVKEQTCRSEGGDGCGSTLFCHAGHRKLFAKSCPILFE
jgi:hypothetical protein